MSVSWVDQYSSTIGIETCEFALNPSKEKVGMMYVKSPTTCSNPNEVVSTWNGWGEVRCNQVGRFL